MPASICLGFLHQETGALVSCLSVPARNRLQILCGIDCRLSLTERHNTMQSSMCMWLRFKEVNRRHSRPDDLCVGMQQGRACSLRTVCQ